jgi:hypothetical protein
MLRNAPRGFLLIDIVQPIRWLKIIEFSRSGGDGLKIPSVDTGWSVLVVGCSLLVDIGCWLIVGGRLILVLVVG